MVPVEQNDMPYRKWYDRIWREAPDYVKRTKVETIVPDYAMNQIVDDILNKLNPRKEAHGMIFIKDVSDAYEIGTKQRGEAVLSSM